MTIEFRHRLLVRVVVHGLVLLTLNAAGFVAIVALVIGGPVDRNMRTLTAWFAQEMCARAGDVAAAQPDILAYPIPAALFEISSDQPLASSWLYDRTRTPPGAVEQLTPGAPAWNRPSEPLVMRCSAPPSRYAVVGGQFGPPNSSVIPLVFALVIVSTLASIPLSRSVVRPLRELVQVAERFGRGELDARAPLARRDEVGELAATFNEMARNLDRRVSAERELLANVSHELRSPLARIRVVFETAREDPSRAAMVMKEIAHDLADLERLTDDVLTTLRLGFTDRRGPDPALRVRLEPVDLLGLVRRAITRCVETFPERELELDAPDRLPGMQGDPALLLRLLENLLDNARKYSRDAIVVRARDTTTHVEIEISDRGLGIAAEDLPRIFEPFFRAVRSRTTHGSGFGLTLCRRITEIHGGTIQVTSDLGHGTTVTVALPVGTDAGTRSSPSQS